MIACPEKYLADTVISLTVSMDGNYDPDMTDPQSEANLSDNIVEVRCTTALPDGSSDTRSGAGLMITKDGFILVPYHTIKSAVKEWEQIRRDDPVNADDISGWIKKRENLYFVNDQKGNSYPIDASLVTMNPRQNIALIKAYIDAKPEPVRFKVNEHSRYYGENLHLTYLTYSGLFSRNCHVIIPSINLPNTNGVVNTGETIIYDIYAASAWSGEKSLGAVHKTRDGALAGIEFCSLSDEMGQVMGGSVNAANLASLVRFSAYTLGRGILDNHALAYSLNR